MRLPSTSQSPAAEARDSGSATAPVFIWPVRVYYEDTDAAGVVYYANYLRYFERCRSEWLRHLGFDQSELAARAGVLFVVASAQIDYRRPARLDDALAIDARVAERLASYVVFEQCAWRGTDRLCLARIKVACVDARTMRPTRLPAEILAGLTTTTPASAGGIHGDLPTTTV